MSPGDQQSDSGQKIFRTPRERKESPPVSSPSDSSSTSDSSASSMSSTSTSQRVDKRGRRRKDKVKKRKSYRKPLNIVVQQAVVPSKLGVELNLNSEMTINLEEVSEWLDKLIRIRDEKKESGAEIRVIS